MGNFRELQEKAKELAEWAKKEDDFGVIYNYDCDGITAGSIVCQSLQRENKQFNSLALKQIYSTTIKEIKGLGKNLFFVDFGSGQLEMLQQHFGRDFAVIDHHQPETAEHTLHFNSMLFGYSGGTEISSSGTSYFFAKQMNKKNSDMAARAIVGAVGDMQEQEGKLAGLNKQILEEGIEKGFLAKKIDLRLYGRITRPLAHFLCYSTSPTIPEITGNEQNCSRFLSELGIELKHAEQWRSYEDLFPEEKRKLASKLIVHMHSHNVPEWKIKELIGEVYTLVREQPRTPLYDAKEFSTLLNACGRNGKSDIALKVCMGDRKEYYEKALSLLIQHRTQLREGIQLVQEKGIEEKQNFYFFDAEDKIKESIIGIVAGMLYGSGLISPTKPIIAFSRNEEGDIKASGRSTSELARRGINLGKIFKEISKEIPGTEGGGHNQAAGVKIPIAQKEKFLEMLEQKIQKSLSAKE